MKKSPLQLEHYTLAEISIKPYEGYRPSEKSQYPSFDEVEFASAVEFGPASRKEIQSNSLWGIKLKLTCQAKEEVQFPYQFIVEIAGVFDGKDLPEEKRSDLVLVNGTSLLYGVLRDEILRLTSRMYNGPLMLPTVQFTHLAENPQASLIKGAKKSAKKEVTKI